MTEPIGLFSFTTERSRFLMKVGGLFAWLGKTRNSITMVVKVDTKFDRTIMGTNKQLKSKEMKTNQK